MTPNEVAKREAEYLRALPATATVDGTTITLAAIGRPTTIMLMVETPPPRCTLSSSRGAHARYEAILTTPPVLFDRALLFEAGEDRADGASRSGALCRFIDMLNQGPEFHRLFAQCGAHGEKLTNPCAHFHGRIGTRSLEAGHHRPFPDPRCIDRSIGPLLRFCRPGIYARRRDGHIPVRKSNVAKSKADLK